MIIAHRGVHNNKDLPENSLVAFKKALDKNYAIEFDIEITKDDKLVIHHDDNLIRMTGINKNVEDMDFNEIRKLHLLNTNEIIPTFKEVLELVNGKVMLDIEIKNTKKVKRIVELVLNELEDYKGDLLLKSFNPFIVKEIKKKTNKYKAGLLLMKNTPNKGLNFLVKTGLIYKFPFDFLAVDKKMLNKDYYDKYINKYPIYVWTFNGLIEAEEYLKKYPKIICICNDLD